MILTLRIFFIGLMAFVPSRDGKELTVLLVDAREGYAVSDGTMIEPHRPFLVARAGSCEGDCGVGDPTTAEFFFPQQEAARAHDLLAAAIDQGGAWQLADSDLAFPGLGATGRGPQPPLVLRHSLRRNVSGGARIVPTSPDESEDFGWVAQMSRIDPSAATVDPDVLSDRPQKGLIVARLHLGAGQVLSYRLVHVGDEVVPIHFQPLRGSAIQSPYTQALADWVMAEIQVSGNAVELVEQRFDHNRGRSMKLSSRDGVVDMTLLNVPAAQFALHSDSHSDHNDALGPGKHFEIYYELSNSRPPNRLRAVPKVGAFPGAGSQAPVSWSSVRPATEQRSDLLEQLRLTDGRGAYDRVICPVVQFSSGGGS